MVGVHAMEVAPVGPPVAEATRRLDPARAMANDYVQEKIRRLQPEPGAAKRLDADERIARLKRAQEAVSRRDMREVTRLMQEEAADLEHNIEAKGRELKPRGQMLNDEKYDRVMGLIMGAQEQAKQQPDPAMASILEGMYAELRAFLAETTARGKVMAAIKADENEKKELLGKIAIVSGQTPPATPLRSNP